MYPGGFKAGPTAWVTWSHGLALLSSIARSWESKLFTSVLGIMNNLSKEVVRSLTYTWQESVNASKQRHCWLAWFLP